MKILLILSLFQFTSSFAADPLYEARGIGGGGAMTSLAISPYSSLRFVATDMGTLFRSQDKGKSWTPVSHDQITVGSDLTLATEIGFSSDQKTVFFSDSGKSPKRSLDEGRTWHGIEIALNDTEHILYFKGSPKNAALVVCGTTEGLFLSKNLGASWTRIENISGRSRGSVFLDVDGKPLLYHATDSDVWVTSDEGKYFSKWYSFAGSGIRGFTGGADGKGVTLALLDSDGSNACAWSEKSKDASATQKQNTVQDCGYVWIQKFKKPSDATPFVKTKKEGGDFIRMAEND